jgi:hypothetical protein
MVFTSVPLETHEYGHQDRLYTAGQSHRERI